jgi:hypothetical protein
VNNIFKVLSGVGAVLAVLVFFWPTPFRYEDGGLTRINRLTGKVQKAGGDGWVDATTPELSDKPDAETPEVAKPLEMVSVVNQDFDSITLKNPGPWGLVLIDKAEVHFDGCGPLSSDYVNFMTADRSLDAGLDRQVRLPYSDSFRKTVMKACGGGKHKRTVTLIVNSANNSDGRRWDAGARLVTRKLEGEVAVPAS